MQTHADFRIGTLVRWHGMGYSDEDVDDIGIVVGLPGEDWQGFYRIAWSVEDRVSEHSPDQVEERLYQRQLEIVS